MFKMIDKKNYNIMFAQEDDFKELSVKINKYFDKDQSYFRNLVPLLYKSGINTYDKHIVCKNEINEIVGVCAIYQKTIYLKENKQYKFIVIGTMSVDQEYRNLGIMSNIFKFIFDNFDDKVDFYCLSGSYERYKNFGFLPSFKTYKYLFNIKEHINYSFELLTENKISDYIGNLYVIIKHEIFLKKLIKTFVKTF
jgi:predicted N-acetyltransferase YhbS